ncbi:MAG: ABC transporter permease [Acidobacteriaceae bacterium]|nr:ABC transporter permease [Acidobacteriaceae bacterium]
MRAIRRLFHQLTSWTTRDKDEQRLRTEIEEHLAMQTADNVRAGLPPDEARRQALLKFGGVTAVKEEYRERKTLPSLETLIQDTRHALRRLRKAPVFTFTIVLTVALGIGATTAIFTLVYAVLLKSLAVANPHELYRLGKQAQCCYYGGYSQDNEWSLVSYDLYKYFRDNTKGFSEVAAFSASEPLFGSRRENTAEAAQSFPGEFVSGNYFDTFGVRAFAGRALRPSDNQPNAAPVVVMSYRLWQQRYGSDPSVIGSIFDLNSKPFTVVGISPPGFYGDSLRPNPPDFFVPLEMEPYAGDGDLNKYALYWLDLIGRVRPGVSPAGIEAEMRVELKTWLRAHWGEMDQNDRVKFPQQTLFLAPGGAGITSMRDEYQHWLQILMMVSGFVLLIVCANVANLMLVRGMERRRETSLSMALGAQPARLVREALTESILLSLFGGAAGLAIALGGAQLILRAVFPTDGSMGPVPIDASPSIPVLLFSFVIALATGILFGIAPAWMATRVDPIEALRGANRSTGRSGSLPRKALVIVQAALALVLLSAAGLFTAALQRLQNQDFGFDEDRRTIINFDARLAGYHPDQLTPLYRRIQDSLMNIPGVSTVALAVYSPLSGNNWGAGVWADGRPSPGPNDDVFASFDRVTPGYFEAIGTPIISGRGITDQDNASTKRVAVVNEALARKFFKNQNPIGKFFGRFEVNLGPRQYEIVGIAKDARYQTFDLDKPVAPFFFLPQAQHDYVPEAPGKEPDPGSHFMRDIVIVTKPGAHVSVAQLRHAIAAVDPGLPIISIRSLKEQVAGVFRQQRLIARLTSMFGLLSLVLASIGLYGVTAYNAGRRTNEIGVRMALGADRADAIALILRGAFILIVIGLLMGLPLAFAVGRFLGHELYGVDPFNPVVTGISVAALGLSALCAALIPALRASSISPIEALRME